jgi:hypothetical protein
VTFSVRLDASLAARVREFVDDNKGRPLRLTLATFTEAALLAHMARLERQLAGREGEPAPSRNSTPTH